MSNVVEQVNEFGPWRIFRYATGAVWLWHWPDHSTVEVCRTGEIVWHSGPTFPDAIHIRCAVDVWERGMGLWCRPFGVVRK